MDERAYDSSEISHGRSVGTRSAPCKHACKKQDACRRHQPVDDVARCPENGAEPAMPSYVVITAAAAAAAALLLYARRRRRRVFAPMATEIDAATRANLERHRWLPLRHGIVRDAVDVAKLEACFDAMTAAFSPQQVDYSNTAYGKDHWKLSCFMEYTNGVASKGIDLASGERLMGVCADVLADCDRVFLEWYDQLYPRLSSTRRTLHRMQSFVTRYRPNPDETHLPRHIDGANVDGSLVLGLPTYSAFGDSGGLTVWDGENDAEEFRYPVAAGEACMLDSRVWHQSNPIAHGERWVIVIFYEVSTVKPPRKGARGAGAPSADEEGGGQPRGKVERELLAKRIKDAARRKELTAADAAKAAGGAQQPSQPHDPAAWQG